MSPAALRLYRADRMLERDFHALRERVLAIVRARLRARGAALDAADLDACYAAAWQGLYGAAVRGEQVSNPAAWLALVTYRRAIEELRLRRHTESELDASAGVEPDVDATLDDRARLRSLVEGMRCRLDLREREAAALCYLHGYSRAEAARLMGISETRMRKLMEGRGPGRAGVSQKIGALVHTISAGEFCREQESLMRALAFGVLDPDGERHRIAVAHMRGCPACRRHVASLRGLAVVLPPVLTLPGAGKAGLAALAAGGHGAPAPAPLGASAAAGSGAAGGGWALGGGGLAAKLAAGCLLVLGVGAGCAVLGRSPHHRGHAAPPVRHVTAQEPAQIDRSPAVRPTAVRAPAAAAARRVSRTSRGALPPREFTPEQPSAGAPRPVARAATAHAAAGGAPAAAAREFAPG